MTDVSDNVVAHVGDVLELGRDDVYCLLKDGLVVTIEPGTWLEMNPDGRHTREIVRWEGDDHVCYGRSLRFAVEDLPVGTVFVVISFPEDEASTQIDGVKVAAA